MDLAQILTVCGILAEAGVVILLFRKKFFAILPVFSSYLTWSLFSDVLIYLLRINFPKQDLLLYYLPEVILDSIFQFAILIELGWFVLRPIRPSLPRKSIAFIALLIAVAGAIIWPFAGRALTQGLPSGLLFWLHLQQTFSVLRIVIFLALAALSQVLAISWRDRELQIATGLGFYSLTSFAVAILSTHKNIGMPYQTLLLIPSAAYVCSLLYWTVSFAQNEAPRRAMSPEVQNVLLTLAGAARTTRTALASSRTNPKQ